MSFPKLQEIDSSLTPESLPKELYEQPWFFLLDSSRMGRDGRWSIAGWAPREIVRLDESSDFLHHIQRSLKGKNPTQSEFPFLGGWIGYIGYEAYSHFEKKVPPRHSDLIPEALFGWYENFYLYDHDKKKAYATVDFDPLKRVARGIQTPPFVRGELRGVESNFTKTAYLKAIARIQDYLQAGDCYQVNLSQRFQCQTEKTAFALYQKLRQVSPAPYSAFLNLGDFQILSTSPESFLQIEGDQVTTRPIKGTRPRGLTPAEDARLKEELITSKKEQAELLMITDLLRNDLGKVCRPGTIQVSNLREIESYAQVHQAVSTIKGVLKEETDVTDLLRVTFPGGSVTGAPKIRAMQILSELETVPRNVYTGAIGYISLHGRSHFNISIRTLILKDKIAYFSAGGGIVADSVPELEYEESLIKAAGIREALFS